VIGENKKLILNKQVLTSKENYLYFFYRTLE